MTNRQSLVDATVVDASSTYIISECSKKNTLNHCAGRKLTKHVRICLIHLLLCEIGVPSKTENLEPNCLLSYSSATSRACFSGCATLLRTTFLFPMRKRIVPSHHSHHPWMVFGPHTTLALRCRPGGKRMASEQAELASTSSMKLRSCGPHMQRAELKASPSKHS